MKKGLYDLQGQSIIYAGGNLAYNVDTAKYIPVSSVNSDSIYIATLSEVMGNC